jgi:hypothetical protein
MHGCACARPSRDDACEAQSDSDTFTELEQWITEHLKGDLRVEAPAEPVVQQSHLVVLRLGKRGKLLTPRRQKGHSRISGPTARQQS